MPIEYEAKVLGIDPESIERLILDRGGQKVGDTIMRRYVYDIASGEQSTWVRLRDSGNGTTLAVKQIADDTIDGTHEIEVGIDDFATVCTLLAAMGFTPKAYQENRRTSYVLDGAQIEIDR